MSVLVRRSLLVALVVAAVLVGSAAAQSTCAKLQYKAAGTAARARAACAAVAAAAGVPIDQACLDAADARLARRWAKALERGDCPTSADDSAARSVVEGFLSGLTAILEPPTESHCCDTGPSCFASPTIDAASCAGELFGTIGAPGTVCDGMGNCVPPPATGGSCCTLPSIGVCSAGPGVDPSTCLAAGGLDFPSGVCLESGACAIP
jgi:hypothetical protein